MPLCTCMHTCAHTHAYKHAHAHTHTHCMNEHALTINNICLLPTLYTPADILDRVTPKFHELGLDYECVGGGRIRHDSKDKKIHIYGYSVVSPMPLMNISHIVSQ